MHSAIVDFANKQKVASISCVDDHGFPYCFSCFYSFNPESGLLHFKSTESSYHCMLLMKRRQVAGTILPNKLNTLAIQGIQFQGELLEDDDPLAEDASKSYHLKYPFAIAMSGKVWTIKIQQIKMTDNTKGFGTKHHWSAEEAALLS